MDNFEEYLETLAEHEEERSRKYLSARERILMNAGHRLNWIGDFTANPKIKFELRDIPLSKVLFTGTNPDWNKILLDKCGRSPAKFLELIEEVAGLRSKFEKEASYGLEPIMMRGPDDDGKYSPIDGMHRLLGAVIEKRESISAYIPMNENEHLPYCEAHTIYDLIRGFQRNARDKNGEKELYHALTLLARTYTNVKELLKTRFNSDYVPDEEVQDIIQKILKEK